MANSNTSLNGYEFGRSPRTTAPFWGGSSEGASIDDTGIYTDKTWSSKKISDELAKKAEASDLANYAKATAVYTKTQTYTKEEVNALLENIPSVDAYTKAEVNTLLADKADKSDTYTKSQVNNLIPDVSGLATKTELNSGLATKANSDDVYSKSQTYTKSEVDNLIADIPAVDAYTKTQTDNLLADKANVSDLANYAKVTTVYTKSQTYTKAEVDDLIQGGGTPVDAYTKAQTDALLADKANVSDVYTKTQADNLFADKANASSVYTKTQTDNLLADKANSSDVYTKSQTYSKAEVNGEINNISNSVSALSMDVADCAKATTVYTKEQTYTKDEVDNLIAGAGGGGGLQEYEYQISLPNSTKISEALMAAVANAITNVGINNLEKLRKVVARTQYTYNTTPHVIEHIYDVKYTSISKGGGNFDDIDICAVGGENYYAAGDNIKTTKLIASRYTGILNTVEQSGANPVVTSTDHSSTRVNNTSSPWYHNQSSPSDLAYKLVFVYG